MGFIFGATFGSIIIAAAIGFFFYTYYKKRSLKKLIKELGQKAEDKINRDLKIWAKHTKNKFIDASLYSYNQNKVFEVDSILITSQAVIVVEIKSINGGIKGSAEDVQWQKVLGEKRHSISNPVIQNQKHIDHILKMLKTKLPVISLIIFSNKAKFIDVTGTKTHVAITKHADMYDVLDNITSKLPIAFSETEFKNVYAQIKSFRTTSKEDIDLHKSITGEKRGGTWK